MKKNTLLFVTMLAMSGMAFGQKEPKVLWEKEITKVDLSTQKYFPMNILLSPNGNILFGNYDNSYGEGNGTQCYLFDKNGTDTSFKKSITRPIIPTALINNKYYLSTDYGGNVYVSDLNYNLVMRLQYNVYDVKIAALYPLDDGVLFVDSNFLMTKYNLDGKVEWKYQSDYNAKLLNRRPFGTERLYTYDDTNYSYGILDASSPFNRVKNITVSKSKLLYFVSFSTNDTFTYYDDYLTNFSNSGRIQLSPRRVLILDEKGKKMVETEPFLNSEIKLVPTSDNGAWIIDKEGSNAEYIKFDSTGKQTAKVKNTNLNYKFSSEVLSPDNSLIYGSYRYANDSLVINKTDILGSSKKVHIKVDGYYNYIYLKTPRENNTLLYYRDFCTDTNCNDHDYFFGSVNFDSPVKSNENKIEYNKPNIGSGIRPSLIFDDSSNRMVELSQYTSIEPNITLTTSLKYFNMDGSLRFEKNFTVDDQIGGIALYTPKDKALGRRVIGRYLYVFSSKKHTIRKIDFKTGADIWKRDATFLDYKIDSKGNILLLCKELIDASTKEYSYRIESSKTDGTLNWEYTLPQSLLPYGDVSIDNRNEIVIGGDGEYLIAQGFKLPLSNKSNSLILSKIGICNVITPISIAGITEACPTESVKLSFKNQNGVIYQWQKDGVDIPNIKEAVQSFKESGTYSVRATEEICQNTTFSSPVKINIRPLPTAEVKATQTSFCEGEKVSLTATTNGSFMQWQKDQKDLPNATGATIEAITSGNYRVGVRDDKCPQIGYSNVIAINAKPLPEANISTDIKGVIYEPFTVKMTANSGTGLKYQWLKDDVIIPNETNAIYEAKKSGKYNVNVSKDGCAKISDALTINILVPLVNQEEVGEEQILVYPNPSDGKFRITLPKTLKSADIQLFDTFGREHPFTQTGDQAQTNGLPQGVYFLKASKGDRSITSKIVIE